MIILGLYDRPGKRYPKSMRRPEFAMTEVSARAFLAQAPVIHLALSRADGAPVLRTLNAAVAPEFILMHGAPTGEKVACVGRPAVAQAEEIVATIPSYFSDPEKACPATTFFRSVQVHGTLERIEEPAQKAKALQLLMERYQPEGGHVPIEADHPLYRNAVRGILVLGLRIEHVTGKAKLGQNRKAAEIKALMESLFMRGAPGDMHAIALMFEHHPLEARPARFRGPANTWLWPELGPEDLERAVDLLEHEYWNHGVSRAQLAAAQLGASVWIGAKDAEGRLVATARAISDGARHAFLSDVVVAERYRGLGLGKALVELLLAHPRLREVGMMRLGTRDAQSFYAPFGFEDEAAITFPFEFSRLVRRRAVAGPPSLTSKVREPPDAAGACAPGGSSPE